MSCFLLVLQRKKSVEYNFIISREKFEPEPGLELGPPDLQPGTLPGSDSNFPLEI